MGAKWINKWPVLSNSSNREYIVALSEDGEWGCSCPAWKFRRQTCKHIKEIQYQRAIHANIKREQHDEFISENEMLL